MSSRDYTVYSKMVPGQKRNYHWRSRFDYTDGFLGITQHRSDVENSHRVLLSPRQTKALRGFLEAQDEVST